MGEGARTAPLAETTADLYRIYALDESEKADSAAVDALARACGDGDAGGCVVALFHVSGRGEHRLCRSESEFPVTVSASAWENSVNAIRDDSFVSRFGPWALPGAVGYMNHWISAGLRHSGAGLGHLVIGRSLAPWTDDEELFLVSIAHTIEPIIGARVERERKDSTRGQAGLAPSRSEERFRAFFEDSRDMVYTTDAEDIITTVNAAGLILTGRSTKSELLGHPFADQVHNPVDRAFFLQRIRDAGYVVDYEIMLVRKNGSAVFGLESAHALRGPQGEIVEVQGIIKDISERIRYEGELWKVNLDLAETNFKLRQSQVLIVEREKLASIGQIAAGVAHEINNPVGFLKSNHLMLAKYTSKIQEAWEAARILVGPVIEEIEAKMDLGFIFSEFDTIFAESDEGFSRIMRIVGNLKSFSRIDRSEELEIYDVNGGIESTLIVAQNEIKYVADTKIDLGDLPRIKARGGEINQVVLNLLVNSAQAIESQKRKEKGLIGIETRLQGDMVRIVIRDDGPGVPESLRKRIFDPFFTTKEAGKGTGLGLSISYDIIVTKHSGKLTVESGIGKGTAFVIELPVAGPSPQ
jgi:PAS domain S-box-containing protein